MTRQSENEIIQAEEIAGTKARRHEKAGKWLAGASWTVFTHQASVQGTEIILAR